MRPDVPELLEAKAAVLSGDMPRLSEFHSKVERIRQAYKPDEARAAMRSLTSLDPVRVPTQPDIVTVYLVRGEEAETVPVLLREVREVKLIGTHLRSLFAIKLLTIQCYFFL